jgi:dihydrofolate reductase
MGYPLIAIVAMAKNRIIGAGGDLPWHLPGDLKRVKEMTMGCPLIMGRKTFESMTGPLAGRANIVLTKNPDYKADGAIPVNNADDAIAAATAWIDEDDSRKKEIIIFGGGVIYRAFLDRIDEIDLTEIDLAPGGDAKFPELPEADWVEISRDARPADGDVPAYAILRLKRR